MNAGPVYYLVGRVPVRVEREHGTLVVHAFNRFSKRDELRPDYWVEINFDRDGVVRKVGEREYRQAVQDLQAESARP